MTNKKRLGLAIPVSLYEKIREEAGYRGKTINALCLDVFWRYFEKNGKHYDSADDAS